eukprot:PhF_6_TR25479/c1_g1_i3/m.35408
MQAHVKDELKKSLATNNLQQTVQEVFLYLLQHTSKLNNESSVTVKDLIRRWCNENAPRPTAPPPFPLSPSPPEEQQKREIRVWVQRDDDVPLSIPIPTNGIIRDVLANTHSAFTGKLLSSPSEIDSMYTLTFYNNSSKSISSSAKTCEVLTPTVLTQITTKTPLRMYSLGPSEDALEIMEQNTIMFTREASKLSESEDAKVRRTQTVAVVRNHERDFNVKSSNPGLSKNGHIGAKTILSKLFPDKPIDDGNVVIVTSPFLRCLQTAKEIHDCLKQQQQSSSSTQQPILIDNRLWDVWDSCVTMNDSAENQTRSEAVARVLLEVENASTEAIKANPTLFSRTGHMFPDGLKEGRNASLKRLNKAVLEIANENPNAHVIVVTVGHALSSLVEIISNGFCFGIETEAFLVLERHLSCDVTITPPRVKAYPFEITRRHGFETMSGATTSKNVLFGACYIEGAQLVGLDPQRQSQTQDRPKSGFTFGDAPSPDASTNDADDPDEVYTEEPPLSPRSAARKGVSAEALKAEDIKSFTPRVIPKSPQDRQWLFQRLEPMGLFSSLEDFELFAVIDAMNVCKATSVGEVIATNQAVSDVFYVVQDGIVSSKETNERENLLTEGCYFGEQCLLFPSPLPAEQYTVASTGGVSYFTLERNTYQKIVAGSHQRKREQYTAF